MTPELVEALFWAMCYFLPLLRFLGIHEITLECCVTLLGYCHSRDDAPNAAIKAMQHYKYCYKSTANNKVTPKVPAYIGLTQAGFAELMTNNIVSSDIVFLYMAFLYIGLSNGLGE